MAKTPIQWVSLDDAADRAGVHKRTIRRYISSGRLAAFRMGPRLVRIDAAELDAFLQPIPTAVGGHDG
ncbi:MAG: helix-turn-helix domain-containing protein [Sporichthyaceae bacterium]|nr:helix-turn-helix domain-containing protein [Sporichthyaceae bacterium]